MAVEISEPCRESLARFIGGIDKYGTSVKWVPAENLHVTLKFLGESAVDTGGIINALKTVRQEKFQAELRGLGCFPNLKHPKIIFAAVGEGASQLKTLASAVEDALEPLGFAKEERGFHPHITIGRVKCPGKTASKIAEKMIGQEGVIFGKFSVDRFCVMKSDLRPRGPVYTKIAELQLF